ncbi:hypothetical protein O1611_g1394 [Lasiodiplodia mahajangana]|uniref:Uncharacterized protein n=1 Tax=Lasiodiplodia mahajangana TaxID=1108764 RepID=A0ACC2JYF8_9PEZI|nr:hypothetical protein O1611_g1394 [Lasiodiplodia mahajangana]
MNENSWESSPDPQGSPEKSADNSKKSVDNSNNRQGSNGAEPPTNNFRLYPYIIVGSGMGGGMVARQLFNDNSAGSGSKSSKPKVYLIEKGGLQLYTHVLNTSRQHFKHDSQVGKGRDNEVMFDRYLSTHETGYILKNGDKQKMCGGGSVFQLGGRSLFWSLEALAIREDRLHSFFPLAVANDLQDVDRKNPGTDAAGRPTTTTQHSDGWYTKASRVLANSPPAIPKATREQRKACGYPTSLNLPVSRLCLSEIDEYSHLTIFICSVALKMHLYWLIAASALGVLHTGTTYAAVPDPPAPEPVTIVELPLPPVTTGSCTPEINPKGTGCIGQGMYGDGFQSGSFLPDGRHIVAYVTFAGAPEAPDPASVYNGSQIILIKTDDTLFPNGDAWKCVTCGVPAENALGKSDTWDYPHAFQDGKRLLVGTNIIDCGEFLLTDAECTPERTFIYPIRWNVTPDGSGAGGSIRELRIHPDNVHLGFSSFVISGGAISQFGYFSRLQFNPSPETGEPLVPRYDLVNVTMLYSPNNTPPWTVNGDQIEFHPLSNTVGELRGFSGRGGEVTFIGYSVESCNIDLFAVELATGVVRRLTAHPEYADPLDISPDDEWTAVMDTRGTGRQLFMAGMRGVPPLIDMVATTVASSIRNNHQRRFFELYMIDRYGDRGEYFGQKINAAGSGVAGSGAINDPEWNGRADPRWSPDGTKIAYWQDLTASPACGEPVSDIVPWGTPYVPGDPAPPLPRVDQGTYTLLGAASGSAKVTITDNADGASVKSVAVEYDNYTDDGINFINGWENYTRSNPSPTLEIGDWYSDMVRTGETNSTKKTSPDGFHLSVDTLINIFEANGTLTTIVDSDVYLQPYNDS